MIVLHAAHAGFPPGFHQGAELFQMPEKRDGLFRPVGRSQIEQHLLRSFQRVSSCQGGFIQRLEKTPFHCRQPVEIPLRHYKHPFPPPDAGPLHCLRHQALQRTGGNDIGVRNNPLRHFLCGIQPEIPASLHLLQNVPFGCGAEKQSFLGACPCIFRQRKPAVRFMFQKGFHLFHRTAKTAVFRNRESSPIPLPFRQNGHGMNPCGFKHPASPEIRQTQQSAIFQQLAAKGNRSGIRHPPVGNNQMHHAPLFQGIQTHTGEHVPVIHA